MSLIVESDGCLLSFFFFLFFRDGRLQSQRYASVTVGINTDEQFRYFDFIKRKKEDTHTSANALQVWGRKKTPTLQQMPYKSRSNMALLALAMPV